MTRPMPFPPALARMAPNQDGPPTLPGNVPCRPRASNRSSANTAATRNGRYNGTRNLDWTDNTSTHSMIEKSTARYASPKPPKT